MPCILSNVLYSETRARRRRIGVQDPRRFEVLRLASYQHEQDRDIPRCQIRTHEGSRALPEGEMLGGVFYTCDQSEKCFSTYL